MDWLEWEIKQKREELQRQEKELVRERVGDVGQMYNQLVSFSLAKHADRQKILKVSLIRVQRLLLPFLHSIYLAEACWNPPRYLPSSSDYSKESLSYG